MGVDACMYMNVPKGLYPDEYLREISYRLASAHPIVDQRQIRWTNKETGANYSHDVRALVRIPKYVQDGPTIVPEEGRELIEVSLGCRFYGEHYERGPIMQILAVAWHLEHCFPKGVIYYGGDSSGMIAEPLTLQYQSRLTKHFFNHGHYPYRSSFHSGHTTEKCPFCEGPMIRFRSGPDYSGWQCPACKRYREVKANGERTDHNKDPKP